MMVSTTMRLAVASLSLLLLAATPLPPPTATETESGKRSPKQATEQPGSITAATETPRHTGASGHTNNDSEENRCDFMPSPSTLTLISTILITLFTGGLWLTTHLQWRATRDAADAAKKSADVAEAALYQVQAAHLYVENATQPVALHVAIVIRNVGLTPAFVHEVSLRGLTTRSIPEIPRYAPTQHHRVPIEIRPNTGAALGPTMIEHDTESESAMRAESCLTYGFIVFEDVFRRRFRQGFGWWRSGDNFAPMPDPAYNYLTRLDASGQHYAEEQKAPPTPSARRS